MTTRIAMTERPLMRRPTRRGDSAASLHEGRRPMTGHVLLAELDGAQLAIVAVDGGSPPPDPVARAEFAVRVLLLHQGRVISDAMRGAGVPGARTVMS